MKARAHLLFQSIFVQCLSLGAVDAETQAFEALAGVALCLLLEPLCSCVHVCMCMYVCMYAYMCA
jgi:hypothetical protein